MKVKAEQVKLALQKKHVDDFFLTEVKNGPTQSVKNHVKLDALAIKRSWANPAIIGYEVKVSRSDFQRDEKWPAYLPLCHQFSFVCPKGLIQPDELPPEVGLIYYDPDTATLTTKRKAMYRLIEEPVDMFKYIIMSRLDSDRHPFYSSKREYFEALVANKAETKILGFYVGEKIAQELKKLRSELDNLQRDRARLEEDYGLMQEVRAILKEQGLSVHRWSETWKDELRQALSGGVNPNVLRTLRRLIQSATEIEKMIGEEAAAE